VHQATRPALPTTLITMLALLAGPLAAAAAGAPSPAAAVGEVPNPLAEVYRALEQPAVGGAFELAGGVLRIGRAEFRTGPGARARPLIAAGRVCGIWIEGTTTLSYRIEDPFSIPLARRNLKHSPALVARPDGAAVVLTLPLLGVAAWGADPALADLSPEIDPGARLPSWLTEILAAKLGANPASDSLVSDRNGDPGYRWAALRGQGDDYLFDFDPRRPVRLESLARLRRIDKDVRIYGGRWTWEEIVAQPIDSKWWDPRPLDVVSVATEVELVNDRADHATIQTQVQVQALRAGIRVLPFSLLQDFSDSDGHARRLALESVRVDGAPALYVQDEGTLLVELPQPLALHQTATLEIRTQGDVLDRPESNSYWILRTQAWYPKLAGVGGEYSTFKMSVESAAPFVPFASGEVLKREKTATGERVTTSVGVPAQWAVAIAGKYETFSRELDGLRVHVSTYAAQRSVEAERLSGIIFGIRACMEHWLGVPFPFQDLQVVEIKDWGWGQAPPGVIFITQEAFMTPARSQGDDEAAVMAAWYTRGVNERIAHEVAHSWFPHVAKVYRDEENWLSESLADYTSAECLLRTMKDKKQGEYLFHRQLSDWKSQSKEIDDGGSIFLAPHISGEKDSDAYAVRHLWYAKGPLVLHALRQELHRQEGEAKGEKDFMAWLRAYAQNFKFKTGETRHLVGILNQITGKDWQPWFESYVYGTETPKVK